MAYTGASTHDSSATGAGSAATGSSAVRTIAVIALLILGSVAAFSANATVWANRTVFNTDDFIATANRVMNEPAVQDRLATRLTTRLMASGEVQARLREELPAGTQFLAPVIVEAASDLVHDIILRLLQNDTVQAATDTALTAVHTSLMRFLEDEGAVTIDDNDLVIDLQIILQRAAEELGFTGDRIASLPPDAGRVVLVEDAENLSALRPVLAEHDTIAWASVALAVVLFAAAIFVARNRRLTVRTVGLLLVLCGLLHLLVLYGLRPIVASFADSPNVANEAFDAFVQTLRVQSFAIAVLGIIIVSGTLLAGDSRVARAIRQTARGGGESAGLGGAIRDSSPALRIGGYIAGVLVLAVWPEPTTRVYVTTFALLALYTLGLWVLTGDSAAATSIRKMVASYTGSFSGDGGRSSTSFAGRNAVMLRAVGIVLALVVLILIPNLTFGTVAAIVALTLIYLSVVEWLAADRLEASER
jgi:hypothetical protein